MKMHFSFLLSGIKWFKYRLNELHTSKINMKCMKFSLYLPNILERK
jgi:hypothetical protein